MNFKIYGLTALISLFTSLLAYFIDYKISLGILLASLFSLFNMFLLSSSMKSMMNSQTPNPSLLMGGNIIRFTLLAVLIYVAIKNPQYFNIIGVTIGLVLFMVALIIDALRTRKAVK